MNATAIHTAVAPVRCLPRTSWIRLLVLAPTGSFVSAPKTSGRKDEAQDADTRGPEKNYNLQRQPTARPRIQVARGPVKP